MSGERATADEASADTGADTATATLRERLAADLADRDGLVLGLDFDGTLAPIVPDPDDAALRAGNRETLRTLADHADTTVAVVSGRALDDVRPRVGVDGIGYVGNAGLERSVGDGDEVSVHPDARRAEDRLASVRETVVDRFGWASGVRVEDKRWSLAVHVRDVDQGDRDRVAEAVGRIADRAGEFHVSRGRSVLEVSPATDANKGAAVADLAADYDDPLVVYVGDDRSDQSAFGVAAERGHGVFVGTDGPADAHHVEGPAAVGDLLDWLATEGLGSSER
jgi:trehalose 6-phosphate phosphatase